MWSTPTTFLMWLICSAEIEILLRNLQEWRSITWLELLTDHVLDVSIEVIAVLDNEAVIKIHHDYASIDFLIKENTVFENRPKKSHSKLRAKRATFTFLVDNCWLKMPKMVNFGEFLKTSACGQTVIPDSTSNGTRNYSFKSPN